MEMKAMGLNVNMDPPPTKRGRSFVDATRVGVKCELSMLEKVGDEGHGAECEHGSSMRVRSFIGNMRVLRGLNCPLWREERLER